MHYPLGRHHHDFALDQFELLVLANDAGFDHATDVLDGECPARETFGSCGDGNVHAAVLSCPSEYSICSRSARRLPTRCRCGVQLWPPWSALSRIASISCIAMNGVKGQGQT